MNTELDRLVTLLERRRIVVLAGAGCSTGSGIPDYRGEGTRARARNPIQGRAYREDPETRRRYWARSVVGWPRFEAARPNSAHRAIAGLEHAELSVGLITQNVDRLHQRAGSRRVVELHGALEDVRCLDCGAREHRSRLQGRLLAKNPDWHRTAATPAPDGDADIEPRELAGFVVVGCEACGGVLKPDVVFFGETVPVRVVEAAWSLMDAGDALLVVGSSLTVFSGYRFVRAAHRRNWPIAVVNRGPTRADDLVDVRVDDDVADVLPKLLGALTEARGRVPV